MNDLILPMLLFFGALAASQFVGRRSLSQLTPEQKLAVMESAPKVPWTLIVIALLYGVESWLSERLGYSSWILGAFMLVLLLIIVGSSVLMIRRLKALHLPSKYINTTAAVQILISACLGFMLWNSYASVRDLMATSAEVLEKTRRK